MSNTLLLLVVLGVNLVLVSFLLFVRLSAGGAPRPLIGGLIVELWAGFGIAVAMLLAISRLVGPSSGAGAGGELADIPRRFALLPPGQQVLALVGLIVAIGLVGHVMWRISRLSDTYPPGAPPAQ